MMLDKTLNPARYDYQLQGFSLSLPEIGQEGDVKVYKYTDESLDISYVEFLFYYGKVANANQAAFSVAGRLFSYLEVGSGGLLFDVFEFYGGRVSIDHAVTYSSIKVYATKKYFNHLVNVLIEALSHPKFSEEHLVFCKDNMLKDIRTSRLDKNYWCGKSYSEIFWEGTAVAQSVTADDIEGVSSISIVTLFEEMKSSLGYVMLLNTELSAQHLKFFKGKAQRKKLLLPFANRYVKSFPRINEEQSVIHSTIPFGKKTSRDYAHYYFYNHILGGCFQSVLSQEIREKQGLTYGIGSSLLSVNENTFLQIKSTTPYQMGDEVVDKVFRVIADFELFLDQNYFDDLKRVSSVSFLTSMENIFSQMSMFQGIVMDGITTSYYTDLLEGIKSCTIEDILKVNKEVLKREMLHVVVD